MLQRELAALPVGFERGHRLSMRGGGHHLIWFLGAAPRDEPRSEKWEGALGKFVGIARSDQEPFPSPS